MNEARRARIEGFYRAFEHLDAAAMQGCYAADARFDDEVFSLQGAEQIGAMWRMLCEATRADGMAHWRLEASAITDHSAHWEAHYLFGATGRLVHNRIDAEFEFDAADLIARHCDRFDFHAWARQALGLPGALLGWTPWLRSRVRAQAARSLQRFQARSLGA
ncbi:nuclear transport factor 2 family protein [Piscinibacter sakaiensis]|uniref:nuclear transport factor 2 family protein n=1 Tax=Piscinibacter sakaiensis TaxID=1547922 RepID=UPI003AADC7C7